ncbi:MULTISPECIES: hypothetical protein [unclassified Pseudomonas]|uniref:hypothetical protein n=1 Tax=unclassified Pseudomonas TaxID=196821 RepID=UPI000C88AF43|nr:MULTISPECIES: hypothetical protein [unclassified Pseudomonas]PMZ87074.1 hypothetical protein C1X61_19780 [Pseudomonas sp. FW215-T2]PNA13450.1 hypothetical protein C1X62_09715 [Pseudomonas sp. FW215-R3]PNB38126.1 hypothetical protein C1X63_09175 [Pseudomonas sp. FW305-131]
MSLRQERAIPAPTLAEHDSDGRLIGVVIDHSQPLSSAEDNAWLGPSMVPSIHYARPQKPRAWQA